MRCSTTGCSVPAVMKILVASGPTRTIVYKALAGAPRNAAAFCGAHGVRRAANLAGQSDPSLVVTVTIE